MFLFACKQPINKAPVPIIRDEGSLSAVPPIFPPYKGGLFLTADALRNTSAAHTHCFLFVNGQAPAFPTSRVMLSPLQRYVGIPPNRRHIGILPENSRYRNQSVRLFTFHDISFQDAAPEGTSPVCPLEPLSASGAPLCIVRSGYFPRSQLLTAL